MFRSGFVTFIMREVQDCHASLLDGSLRMVLKMLTQWKTLITMSESERKVCNQARRVFSQ